MSCPRSRSRSGCRATRASQLGHQRAVTSGQEIRLDAILERRGVQPDPRPGPASSQPESGERRAAPLRKRGVQATRGALGQPRGERPPPLVAQRLEPLQVQLTGLQMQPVAVRRRHEPASSLSARRSRDTAT